MSESAKLLINVCSNNELLGMPSVGKAIESRIWEIGGSMDITPEILASIPHVKMHIIGPLIDFRSAQDHADTTVDQEPDDAEYMPNQDHGLWIYNFQSTLGQTLSYNENVLQDVWVLVSWIVSAIPYIAIPAAVLHSCMSYDGSCSEKVHYLMCGSDEDDRREDYDGYYPAPEPTAPPYYMDNNDYLYPMNDLAKNYDPELEPLNTNLRHTNM